jgi:RNA polymerase sigma-70 factor, ECF subfamily
MSASQRRLRSVPDGGSATGATLEDVVDRVARGDEQAFEELYQRTAGQVLGVALRVVRDPAQSEEVAQEVLVEVWRTAARFDRSRGGARTWILGMAHARAVDRVRSAQATTARDERVGRRNHGREYDEVSEEVELRMEQQAVRGCLAALTPMQREAVQLAYYGGHTYREVADLLDTPLGTVKTRLRDGLIRLRDCLGVTA